MTSHVVIVGGGIAGCAAAVALRRAGIAVTVVEKRPASHEGAVVRVNPNGIDALRAIGADQSVIAVSFPLLRFEWYTQAGRIGYRLTADPSSERGMPRVMAWAHLAQTLREDARSAGATIHHGARVADVAESAEQAYAILDDGTRIVGDIVVGADGAHSAVRTRIDPDAPPPWPTGTRTVYGFTPTPTFEPPPPEVLRGYVDRGFFGVTRDSFTGGCYWFTSLPAPQPLTSGERTNEALWRSRLLAAFGADANPAAPAVRDADRILAFDDHALTHLPHWHSARMVVIGDAAHIAPPGSEQGASMALEDGVVLAQCLRDAEPAAALAAFTRRRRTRAEAVVTLGLGGTLRAPANRHSRWARWTRDRLDAVRRRTILDVGGRSWLLNHHIDWDDGPCSD